MQDEAQTAIPKILLVDDNEREAENAKTWFEMAFEGLQLHFILQNPSDLPGVSDYVKYIDALPVSALLIDHRLNESASANYTGLELADSLRNLRPMLPIFILTKYAKDDKLEERGFSVDDVMDKSKLRSSAKSYLGRILRATKRYEEARSEQSKRMRDLIALSFDHKLTTEETKELFQLRAEVGIDTIGKEIEETERNHRKLEEVEEILDAFRKLIQED